MILFKTKHRQIELRPIVAWYDMWIGLYWNRSSQWLYIFPIPMCGFILKFNYRWGNITIKGSFNKLLGPGLRKDFLDKYNECDDV